MAAVVAVYEVAKNKRSHMIADAMRAGIFKVGDKLANTPGTPYHGPTADVAAFYGFDQHLRQVFRDYRALNKPVILIDLGYWQRREGGSLTGYHKVSVNARHPTAYFRARPHAADRFRKLGVPVRPWTSGQHVLVCGMSAKSAEVEGFRPEEWENGVITTLRALTDRPIFYRPKPSWADARPIPGTRFCPEPEEVTPYLADCHAIVTHHSNTAIDGLMAGIPSFCWDGVAAQLSLQDLHRIERPHQPEGRDLFAHDLAYAQWRPDEMRNGAVFRHLKNEGLIP